MLCTREGFGHTGLDSLCIVTVKDHEFLDTLVHVDDHARMEECIDGTHRACTIKLNYGFTHVYTLYKMLLTKFF